MAAATMTMPAQTPTEPAPRPRDEESRLWLRRLGGDGPEREAAVAELHGLLLRAARFEIERRRASLPHLNGGDHDDLAHQSADDALVAVLAKLGEFRGESRFTTWAYKFALLEAGVKVRRRAWQGREVPLEEEGWARLAGGADAGRPAEDAELLAAIREEIEACLSPRQRQVLVAVALNGVPIDVLAERLQSNRGALYKSLHDARRKLRAALAARGYEFDPDRKEER
ncbi:MAG TPA: sigma-70 family RNA polymerase sigma factor [Solirubrobacterales bacterium]|nr:sigma-70 family RNA polymerase sigma factor [Solirubrobacterales bacterium]